MTPDPSNPATLIDEDGLPLTPFAIDQLRHQRVTELNERRERFRLRRANQKKGFDEPKVGQTYHVQLDGSISRRTRGSVTLADGTAIPGVRFEKGSRVAVEVLSDEKCAEVKSRAPDAPVVTVVGAERILEDNALHVFEAPMSEDDVDELKRSNAALEEEIRLTREDNVRMRAQLAERAARMSAPESTDGRPSRLPAARAARAASETAAPASAPPSSSSSATAPGHGDFGAPADQDKK